MSDVEQIAARLQELSSFIEDAQTKLNKGEVVNLSHLDGEVEQICEQALKLKPELALKVQPIMATMISRLEELGLALKDFQSNLKPKGSTH